MVSVTRRIAEVQQPRGGYVNPKLLSVETLGANALAEVDQKLENVHPTLVGLSVDYLTRLAGGAKPQEVFHVSLMGATKLGLLDEAFDEVDTLKAGRVNADAIAAACKLASFDVGFRNNPSLYNPDAQTQPDATTTEHIRVMVDRSLAFLKTHGPLTLSGFTFRGGYTALVDTGDGDFLTADTLWDFKVSVAPPTNKHTLQLLMYYMLGKHSKHQEFQPVTHIGVFNPRLNTAYRLRVGSLPAATLADVSREVMGYEAPGR